MKACARQGCQTLHRNKTYCCRACRNTGEWRKNVQKSLVHARKMKAAQFQQLIARMIQRVKYLGQTEDERIVLAWRYGLGASKQRRYRAKVAARRARREAA